MTNVIALCSALFVLISELNLFKGYYARNMPLLSDSHGFVTLSLVLFILGNDILAKLNHDSNTKARLGLPFWRTVIAAGILCFVLSIINLVANYIFRDQSRGLTARQIRAHGNKATPSVTELPISEPVKEYPVQQQEENPFSLRRSLHLLSHPFRRDTHVPPMPSVEDAPPSPSSRYSRATDAYKPRGLRFPVRTSPVDKDDDEPVSPIEMPARPDSAVAPAKSNGGMMGSYRWR